MENQKVIGRKINDVAIPSFPFEKYGAKGVGRNRHKILTLDQYIDHSHDAELHKEICHGLALSNDYKMGMTFGAMPPHVTEKFCGNDCWSEMFRHLPKDSEHYKSIEELLSKAPGASTDAQMQLIYRYMYFAMGAPVPWFFALYLKKTSFATKTRDRGGWAPAAQYFPKLLKYIETLPFKEIGRIMFFTTYPNAGVLTHRDAVVTEHSDHNINLFFTQGWRPSYVWDEITEEKHYLPKGARSYFFNNRDYHGVDPEPAFRYTLRIDGTFTDELCEELGLEDGFTWKWDYEKSD